MCELWESCASGDMYVCLKYIRQFYITAFNYNSAYIQWNLSNQDTNRAEESVIVSEVSSFQRLKCMQEWYILGVGKGVLFREVSSV